MYNVFNYGSLAVVVLFIIIMLTRIAPRQANTYFLVISILLLVFRIFLRIKYLKHDKTN